MSDECKHEKAYGYCLAKLGDEMVVLCVCPECEAYFDRPIEELENHLSHLSHE